MTGTVVTWRPPRLAEVYEPAAEFTDQQWEQLHQARDLLSALIGQGTHPGGPLRAIHESDASECPGQRSTARAVRLLNLALTLTDRWDEHPSGAP